jgi:nitroreductase
MEHATPWAEPFSTLVNSRRSTRDFLPDPIPQPVLDAVLADANASPSWSNTQPYRIAIASGALRDRMQAELTQLFDAGMAAQRGGWWGKLKLLLRRKGMPDGDFVTNFEYPSELQPQWAARVLGAGRRHLAANADALGPCARPGHLRPGCAGHVGRSAARGL